MFSKLTSAFNSAADWTKNAASTVKNSLKSAASGVDNFLNSILPPEADYRPEVRQRVGAQVPGLLGDDSKKGRLSNVMLDLPDPVTRNPMAKPDYTRMPSSSLGKTGLFGIQFHPKDETLAPQDSRSTFQDFAYASNMDETPMTPMYFQSVRQHAIKAGYFDYDAMSDLRDALPPLPEVTAPAPAKVMSPAWKPAEVPQMQPANAYKPLTAADYSYNAYAVPQQRKKKDANDFWGDLVKETIRDASASTRYNVANALAA